MGVTRNSSSFCVESSCPVLPQYYRTCLSATYAGDKLVVADPAGVDHVYSDMIPDSYFIHRKPEVLL